MDFGNLARRLAGLGLPLLGQALGGPAGRTVAAMIGGVIGLETDDPAELEAAIGQSVPAERIAELQELEIRKRHELEMFAQQAAAERIATINETMRTEARAEDPWSRRWRPFWGFVSAITFFLAVLGILVLAFAVAFSGEWQALNGIPPIVNAIMLLFGLPMTVLGVAAHHRGVMQRIQAGEVPAAQTRGVFQMLRDMGRDDPPRRPAG